MAGLCAVGFKQVFKLAQRVGADHVALVADKIVGGGFVLAQVDVEVIEPEVGHHFLQLGVGIDVAGEALGNELFGDEALGVFEGGHDFLLFRGIDRRQS